MLPFAEICYLSALIDDLNENGACVALSHSDNYREYNVVSARVGLRIRVYDNGIYQWFQDGRNLPALSGHIEDSTLDQLISVLDSLIENS